MEDRLERVLTLIRNHSHSTLDLARLADTASLSRFHFLRLFHRTFRQTPHQLIIRTRIERAKTLLTETAKSVTEICLEVGFDSLGTFSTQFHRRVGYSPSVFRQKTRDQRNHPRNYIPECYVQQFHLDSFLPK